MPRNYKAGDLDQAQTNSSVKNKASKFALPDPMELAKLAAILSQGLGANTDREVKAALTKALQFYLEAVFFHREQSPKSLANLITEFGSDKRFKATRRF